VLCMPRPVLCIPRPVLYTPRPHTVAVFAVAVVRTRNLTLQKLLVTTKRHNYMYSYCPARQRRGMDE